MSKSIFMSQKTHDLIGIGNALLDILAPVPEGFPEQFGLNTGTMNLIDIDMSQKILQHLPQNQKQSGGSVANSIAGFATLGGKAGFVGKLGNDDLADHFIKDLQHLGATWCGTTTSQDLQKDPQALGTGHCLVLVSPNGERTMCTWLGCASQLNVDDIHQQNIENAKILYLEGYLFDSPTNKQAFFHAVELARRYDCKTALSLSDEFCVDRHRDDFNQLIASGIDIVFANEGEAISLLQTTSRDSMLKKIANLAPITCVTLNKEGSVIFDDTKQYDITLEKVEQTIDSTGAGDQYAAGFLYAHANAINPYKSAIIASKMASAVVCQMGARLSKDTVASIQI